MATKKTGSATKSRSTGSSARGKSSSSNETGSGRSSSGSSRSSGSRSGTKKKSTSPVKKKRQVMKDRIWAVVLICLGIFMAISMQTQTTGEFGMALQSVLKGLFGLAALILPYYLIIYGILLLTKTMAHISGTAVILLILMYLSIVLFNSARFLDFFPDTMSMDYLKSAYVSGINLESGGAVGMFLSHLLVKFIGVTGLYLFASALLIICIILLADTPASKLIQNIKDKRAARRAGEDLEEEEYEEEEEQEEEPEMPVPAEKPKRTRKKAGPEQNAGAILASPDDVTDIYSETGEMVLPAGIKGLDVFEKDAHGATAEQKQNQILEYVNEENSFGISGTGGMWKEASAAAAGMGPGGAASSSIATGPAGAEAAPARGLGAGEAVFPAMGLGGAAAAETEGPGLRFTAAGRQRPVTFPENQNEIPVTDFRDLEGIGNGDSGEDTGNSAAGTQPGAAGAAGTIGMGVGRETGAAGVGAAGVGATGRAAGESDREPADGSAAEEELELRPAIHRKKVYKLPPASLLKKVKQEVDINEANTLHEQALRLEKVFKDFGVDARVVDVCKGPSVTRYEVQPATGVKVHSITKLQDDLALNLRAKSIRMEAPIPGKAAVGIEVQNDKSVTVTLREMIESPEFKNAKSKISFVVGKNISGECVVADLKSMPHMLIAGSTGSGKSVCINSILMSMLFKSSPDEVRFLLVDPKVVELGNYNGIPHMLIPVVTDPAKAAASLAWAVTEMDDRYAKFAFENVRDLASYNDKLRIDYPEKVMPQIVIIIDELADLMMTAAKQVEEYICRLAQKARAAGIHMILATQRPSTDVITGLIKANIPSRISFAVSSGIDSRTILDTVGAEKLLGKGDMLFSPIGESKPIRLQGPFVPDEEVNAVIDFWKEQAGDTTDYSRDVMEHIENIGTDKKDSGSADMMEDNEDELLRDAIEAVISAQQASASMLQRRFRIGYNRAARLVDIMEERGIIGPSEGSKARKVLWSQEAWEAANSMPSEQYHCMASSPSGMDGLAGNEGADSEKTQETGGFGNEDLYSDSGLS